MSDKTVAEQIAVVVHLSRTAGGSFAQLPIETLERWIREIEEEKETAAEVAIAASSLDSFGGYSIVP